MNAVSLFTGAGGADLAALLLGWRSIAYVEIEEYFQQVIAQRISDGILPRAPIFGDIRLFNRDGYARRYRGMADIIIAGPPCQPFSSAGSRKGGKDPRNMWPHTIECIRIIRPRFALLENVPGFLSRPYGREVFGALAEAGYDADWCVLGVDDCNGPHRRKRVWVLAYPNMRRQQG